MDAVDRLFALVDAKYKEQKDFAADIGVDPARISEWRNRRGKSYTKYLPRISAVLGTSADYILNGNENGPAPKGAEPPEVWALLSEEGKRKAREYMEMLKALEDKR